MGIGMHYVHDIINRYNIFLISIILLFFKCFYLIIYNLRFIIISVRMSSWQGRQYQAKEVQTPIPPRFVGII